MTLWGGRFSKDTAKIMREINDSFNVDQILYRVDILGSQAYARALAEAQIITKGECKIIVEGLSQVLEEFDTDSFIAKDGDEDVHTAVERRLTEIIGAVGGKLHTGRSRNDQVALDIRLWLAHEAESLISHLIQLQTVIIECSETHLDCLMPGYTHLQPAQPILFSHWLMSFFWMFERDKARIEDCLKRIKVSPLGSGALAGNPFPIDRNAIASELGFHAVTQNSLDAVSDRDFILEFLFVATTIGLHLSRLAEDIIIYSSDSYGFIRLDETYTTGSSLMPQKRNPDSMELTRGKSGRLIGNLITLLTVLKSLPSTYNKDLQEDKEPLFDSVMTLRLILSITEGVINTMTIRKDRMTEALDQNMLATALSNYLVRKGMPFRESHHVVGGLVSLAESRNCRLSELSLNDFQERSVLFENDIFNVLSFENTVSQYKSIGGTATSSVKAQLREARHILELNI